MATYNDGLGSIMEEFSSNETAPNAMLPTCQNNEITIALIITIALGLIAVLACIFGSFEYNMHVDAKRRAKQLAADREYAKSIREYEKSERDHHAKLETIKYNTKQDQLVYEERERRKRREHELTMRMTKVDPGELRLGHRKDMLDLHSHLEEMFDEKFEQLREGLKRSYANHSKLLKIDLTAGFQEELDALKKYYIEEAERGEVDVPEPIKDGEEEEEEEEEEEDWSPVEDDWEVPM